MCVKCVKYCEIYVHKYRNMKYFYITTQYIQCQTAVFIPFKEIQLKITK